MAKKNTFTEERARLIEELENSFVRWEVLFNLGGEDPYWQDGANMYLVRNHISHAKANLLKLCGEGRLPELWHRPTPPEMPWDYMAQEDELLRKGAELVLSGAKEATYVRDAMNRGDLVALRRALYLLESEDGKREWQKQKADFRAEKLKELRAYRRPPGTSGTRLEWQAEKQNFRVVTQLSLV